jgi:hypothetical protein
MELVERASFMATENEFENVIGGEGRCILLTGEAGIGKTSLEKFPGRKRRCKTYIGTCDALFTRSRGAFI